MTNEREVRILDTLDAIVSRESGVSRDELAELMLTDEQKQRIERSKTEHERKTARDEGLKSAKKKLERDLGVLRYVGVPIDASPRTNSKGSANDSDSVLRFILRQWEMPRLDLNEEEVRAISCLPAVTGGDPWVGIATVKLFGSLYRQSEYRQRPFQGAYGDFVRNHPHLSTDPHSHLKSDPKDSYRLELANLDALYYAVCQRKRVKFHYLSRSGSSRERHVEPYAVSQRRDGWYLVARDVDLKENRVFRLDRIPETGEGAVARQGGPTRPDFELPDDLDVESELDFRKLRPVDVARIAISPDFDPRRLPGGSQQVDEVSEGWRVYEVYEQSERVLLAFALRAAPEARVLEPAQLREAVVARLRALAEKHARDGSSG